MELLPLSRTIRFLNSRAFDGFRKMVANEFNHIYIVDLGAICVTIQNSLEQHTIFLQFKLVCDCLYGQNRQEGKNAFAYFLQRERELRNLRQKN